MVPILTCGLFRSNFALPTMILLRTYQCFALRPWWTRRGWVLGDLNADTTASLATDLLDDLFSDVLGNLRVGVELHRVVGTTLSLGSQGAHVYLHLSIRQQRLAGDIADLGLVESTPKQDGRNMIMVIGPTKKK